MPKPFVIVLTSRCLQQLQLLPVLLCVGRDVLGLAAASCQSKNGLLVTFFFRPAPLTVAARCGTAVLFDGRDALGCFQLAV